MFQENIFPYSVDLVEEPVTYAGVDEDWVIDLSPTLEDRGSEPQNEPVLHNPSSSSHDNGADTSLATTPSSPCSSPEALSEESTPTTSVPTTENEDLGQGKRAKFPSVWLKDYVAHATRCPEEPHLVSPEHNSVSSSSVQGNTLYPLTSYISDDMFSPQHKVFLAVVLDGVEPTSYKQAMLDPRWTKAMGTEVGALEDSGTWSIVDLPPGKEAINNKWVYKIKLHADGTVERYKARIVACGNRQVEGEDYNETFAPVIMMKTVRGLLRIVAAEKWEVHQMDVHNAFLHGDLDEEVYMKLPVGFRHSDSKKVLRLHKSLYGLKQAPRCWFARLSSALTKFGFV